MQAAINLSHLPASPIVLTMPDFAALRLSFVDDAGQPCRRLEPEFLRLDLALLIGGLEVRHLRTFVHGTQVRIAMVEPGARFRLSGECDVATVSAEFDGPRHAGQELDVAVQVHFVPVLTGRFVDSRGTPIRDLHFCARHFGPQVGMSQGWSSTDEAGRFSIPVPPLFGNPMDGRRVLFLDERSSRRGLLDLSHLSLR